MSQLTGAVVTDMAAVLPDVPGHVIASALALLAGAVVVSIGLIRCGWIVDIISLTSLSAFMTGSAICIAVGQVPSLMGLSGFSTRDPTYLVFVNILKHLNTASMDAAMGLSALAMLYLIRGVCMWIGTHYPKHQKLAFFISTLRVVFVIVLYTLISYLVNRSLPRGTARFKILFDVPRGMYQPKVWNRLVTDVLPGFQNAAVPVINTSIVSNLMGYLPATVVVLLIEHIAISKSFGRVNNYRINPSQEMVAIGITNMMGPFLGGYAATGSFSRTAIKSKAGVRTPFAGVITAFVVLLAIYALPAVFYYIPNASLSAVIIHAVGDLITPPNTVYQFWLVSPFEVLIFFVGVFVTIFSSIENGIYTTVLLSAAMLLFRILRSNGRFLGRVKVQSMLGNRVIGNDRQQPVPGYGTFTGSQEAPTRNIFLPITHADGSNPEIELDNPYPGIFIYRFAEGFSYPNAGNSLEHLVEHIFAHTRRTNLAHFDRPGDRPWNEPGPSRKDMKAAAAAGVDAGIMVVDVSLPTLKAVILDFSSVNHVDITSVQQLIDVRNQLDRYASPDIVDWHIACINNRWAKRALAAAGFGYPTVVPDGPHRRWRSIFSVAEIGGSHSAAAAAEVEVNEKEIARSRRQTAADVEVGNKQQQQQQHHHRGPNDPKKVGTGGSESVPRKSTVTFEDAVLSLHQKRMSLGPELHSGRTVVAPVHGINRPLFHVDLTSALQSAVANVEGRYEGLEEHH